MENKEKDWVLVVWVAGSFVWDIIVGVGFYWVVFVLNRSAWWILLAIYCWYTPTLFKVLRKRYGIPEES